MPSTRSSLLATWRYSDIGATSSDFGEPAHGQRVEPARVGVGHRGREDPSLSTTGFAAPLSGRMGVATPEVLHSLLRLIACGVDSVHCTH